MCVLKEIIVTANFQHLGSLISSDAPQGVSVIFEPPVERRAVDFNVVVNVDITLAIDLGTVSVAVVSAWLVRHFHKKSKLEITVNGKEVPKIESQAKELIENEINQK
jgi:hypothetical protein